MLTVTNLAMLKPGTAYWVASTVAPVRDWDGAPGCRRGARFLIDPVTLSASRTRFAAFETRSDCLRWIMAHRIEIGLHAPAAGIHATRLDEWILGMDTAV